jgi:parallel beta-helix repeat protein
VTQLTVAAVATAFAAGGMAPAVSGSGAVLMVDDDGRASPASCDGHATAERAIQRAVAVAAPGSSVLVCPGTYREDVTIGRAKRGLTLRSVVPWGAQLIGPGSADAVVGVRGARGVVIDGFDIRVRGRILTWTRVPSPGDTSCRPAWLGISITGGASAVISGNRIDRGHRRCGYHGGILVSSSEVVVAGNVIRDWWSFGVGIFSERDPNEPYDVPDPTLRATVTGNQLRYVHRDYVREDAVVGDQPWHAAAIQSFDATLTDISENDIRGTSRYVGEVDEVSPLTHAIEVSSARGAVVVRDGRIHGDFRYGINVAGEYRAPIVGARVWRNEVTGTGAGMVLRRIDRSSIRSNRLTGNGSGIELVFARHNRVEENDARGNTGLDCRDRTREGDGTAGTRNFWIDDLGDDADPPGICRPG